MKLKEIWNIYEKYLAKDKCVNWSCNVIGNKGKYVKN